MRMKSRRTLAVLLSMILLLALAPSGFAVDLDPGANTLTVNLAPADSGFAEDLAAASIQADLYLLAPATAAGTDDSYTYAVPKAGEKEYPSPFQTQLEELMTKLADDPDLEKQNDKEKVYSTFEPLAQAFAGIVLSKTYSGVPITGANVSDHTTITVTGLDAGLYLLIIRGTGLTTKDDNPETDYVVKTEQASGEDGAEKTVTYATRVVTDDYEYLYRPQLLTVPTKVSEENVQQYNTAYGNWVNSLTIYAKPTREANNGDLKIIKNVSNPGPDPVDFVFEVTWKDKSNNDVTKVVTMTFKGDTRKEYTLVNTVPIGTKVTVTEVHSGIGYTAVTGPQTVTIEATPAPAGSEPAAVPNVVEFSNDHTGPGGGHGILNRFTADGSNFSGVQYDDSDEADQASRTAG